MLSRFFLPVCLVLTACTTAPVTPTLTAPVNPIPAAKQLPVGTAPGGIASTYNFLYVANEGASTISVIDPRTEAVVKTVELTSGTPGAIDSFRAGRFVLVADVQQNRLAVLDSFKDHQILQTVPLDGTPTGFAIGSDDRTVLVTLADQPKLVVLNFEADRAKPPAKREIVVGQAAGKLDLAYDGTWAVVGNEQEQKVSMVEVASGQVRTLTEGRAVGPVALGVERQLDTLQTLATLVPGAEQTLALYPPAGGEAKHVALPAGKPTAIAVDDVKTRAYIGLSGPDAIAVVDFKQGTLVGTVPLPQSPARLDLAPLTAAASYRVNHLGNGYREVWVSYANSPNLTIVEGETFMPIVTFIAGEGSHQSAFWGAKAFVSNRQANSVSVVDRRTFIH